MKIKIKKLHPDAKLPSYAHEGDAGMDLYSIEQYTLKPDETHIFNIGISIEIPTGYFGLVHDKSSFACKHGLKTMGGVMDSGFRGEYGITLRNLSDKEYTIKKGDKIAQLLILPVAIAELEEVIDLTTTKRGAGSFGSTGKQ